MKRISVCFYFVFVTLGLAACNPATDDVTMSPASAYNSYRYFPTNYNNN